MSQQRVAPRKVQLQAEDPISQAIIFQNVNILLKVKLL